MQTITGLLKSKKTLVILLIATFLNIQKPGYLVFLNLVELLPKECSVAQTFTIPNLPWLQKGLTQSTTIDRLKQQLGAPTCYQNKKPLWLISGFYLGVEMNKNGIITGYQFYR